MSKKIDLSGLPAELIAELSVGRTDELEQQILAVLRERGEGVALDDILVGLYRRFGVIQTRRRIQSRLYRMRDKELVRIERKRAFLTSTAEPTASDREAQIKT